MRSETYTYKSKGLAIVLGLFLGGLGVHKFYLGQIGWGFAYVVLTCLLFMTPLFWLTPLAALIDIIFIATKDQEYFKRLSGYTETATEQSSNAN